MRTTETRRIQSSGLTYGDYGSGKAYWGTYTRYRNGSRVYQVPFGIVWWSGSGESEKLPRFSLERA